ncbi:PREDICTED: aldose reductase-like [Rhagoletis zephyria]|uniref:aldose reductase-like n=1 Tax=Rhagoletis zephyria TaxID=28612 RepID=UPI000811325F|nr:PREDICTED: aldose reductase-like [Rhagoletis zephyria]
MQKLNIGKFTSNKFVRAYSGEYRIFKFLGFGNKITEGNGANNAAKNCVTTTMQETVSGTCIEPMSNTKDSSPTKEDSKTLKNYKYSKTAAGSSKAPPKAQNGVEDAAKELCSAPAKKSEHTLKSKKECGEKKATKRPEKSKCLKPVSRLEPVKEPPDDCNVKKAEIPKIKLNDGCTMPLFGLGTFGSNTDQAYKAVKHAINVGYRMIDCAHVYQNEQAVGKAINETIKNCIVNRDELFITSKLWNTFHRPELVLEGCCRSLNDLNLSYLDLYLIHWPMGFKEGKELIPNDACGRVLFSHVDYVDTWKAMEDLVHRRLTRSIGISNFNKKQVERILNIAKIKPVVNQVECHPYLNQMRLMAYLKKKKILLVAYSPLGSPGRSWAKDEPYLLGDNMIKSIAFHHGRTAAQICLRYQLQRGNAVIPKSVTPSRIESNFNVADFELDDHEMEIIDKLDKKLRLVPLSNLSSHPHYPFHDEY